MNIVTTIYIFLGVFILMIFVSVILFVAGKDMFMAFKRLFLKYGSDVYIVNTNRNVTHYYKVPSEGIFIIKGLKYVTNPEKTLNLTDVDKLRVIDSIKKTDDRLNKRIVGLNSQIDMLNKTIQSLPEGSEEKRLIYSKEVERLNSMRDTLINKLQNRVNNYFSNKRSAYFYIEGDPVPKDFYEFYSAIDCKILDNIVSRKLSEPTDKQEIDKQMSLLKLFVIVTAIGAVASAIIALRNSVLLDQLCNGMGVVCKFP